MNKNDNKKLGFLWVFVILIAVSSYMTTAFLIHTWPFEGGKKADQVENQELENFDFLEGMDSESYEISSGGRIIFDGFSMVYPKGWVLMNIDGSESIVGVGADSADVSVAISKIGFGSSDKSTPEKLQRLLAREIDSWYMATKTESVDFLSSNCVLFSGDVLRGENVDGMMVLAIPYGELVYLLTGVFPIKAGNQKIVDEIFATFRFGN
jgi:hypothetical protein